MSFIETFEANEATALEGLDADLAAVARTSAQRAIAIVFAQQADVAASDEGRAQREAARMAAIEADAALRTGLKGRPPISDERSAYRALCEQHDEGPDSFKLAMDRYANVISQLKAAAPDLDGLQAQADEQVKLAQQTVQHLERAAETFAEAVKLADGGRAVMAQLCDLVAFSVDPFVDLASTPRELADLAKRWDLRLAAELARLGVDDESALIEQRERQATAKYAAKLKKAVAAFHRTPDGRQLWKEYQIVARGYATAQAERPEADLGGVREQAQRLLSRFYEAAAGHGNLEFEAGSVPQVE